MNYRPGSPGYETPICGVSGSGIVVAKAGDTSSLPQAYTQVSVFYPNNAARTITIEGAHLCTAIQAAVNQRDGLYNGYYASNPGDLPGGVHVTRYALYKVDANGNPAALIRYVDGVYRGGTGAVAQADCDGSAAGYNENIAVNSADLVQVPGLATPMWRVIIRATHINLRSGADGISNGFRVSAPGGIVGIAAGTCAGSAGTGDCAALANTAGAMSNSDLSKYRTILQRFGSDCTVTSTETAYISFRDLDYPTASDNQRIRITIRDVTASPDQWLINDPWTTIRWSTSQPSFANAIDVPPLNGGTRRLPFTAQPNHSYILYLINVSPGLTTQVGLPFDGAYYGRTCTIPRLTPSVSLPASISVGQSVTAGYKISNTGNGSATVNYTREFWLSNFNDGAIHAGDTRLVPSNSGAVSVPTSDYTFGSYTTTASDASKYICASLVISNPNPGTTVISGNPAHMCVPVSKAPSLAVAAGDVRTGGSYGMGTCSMSDPGTSVIGTGAQLSKYFGIRAFNYAGVTSGASRHTYIRDAALSLGEISNVATNSSGPGGVNSSLHFARDATTPPNQELNEVTEVNGGLFYGISGSAGVFTRAPLPNFPVTTHCLSPLFAAGRYPTATATVAPPTLPAPTSGTTTLTYTVAQNGTVTLNAPSGNTLSLTSGQRYIIRIVPLSSSVTTAKVVLNMNVQYAAGTVSDIANLPQFVLLAGSEDTPSFNVSLQVAPGVTRLDGIYAVRGTDNDTATFSTCSTKASERGGVSLTTGDCSSTLIVNGAVVVGGRLNPYRTAGHSAAADRSPAETFNLRADTLLSDYARNAANPTLRVVSQRELAPRY
jgi:hypothetical protein